MRLELIRTVYFINGSMQREKSFDTLFPQPNILRSREEWDALPMEERRKIYRTHGTIYLAPAIEKFASTARALGILEYYDQYTWILINELCTVCLKVDGNIDIIYRTGLTTHLDAPAAIVTLAETLIGELTEPELCRLHSEALIDYLEAVINKEFNS